MELREREHTGIRPTPGRRDTGRARHRCRAPGKEATPRARPDTAPHEATGIIAAGRRQALGCFRFRFADQRRQWSDEVARTTPSLRSRFDHLLLTAHERIPGDAESEANRPLREEIR
ncbi:hypothetical protein [Nocardia sp. BMG111209]|uniref:hypothetical protein n=1 Tax=Nocardia sp. BMG111209 TaxID=1160137 RepID=UPI0003709410|nr:hypothetical protein [Nocardia sp. BMG111209]